MLSVVVADSSVLIVLAKVRRLDLLRRLYGTVLVGPAVRHEVVDEGRRVAALGLHLVERAISDGWLQECRPTLVERRFLSRLQRETRLGAGEIEALSLAKHRVHPLLVDDKEARMTAETLGIDYTGTMGVLLEGYQEKELTLGELEVAVSDISRVLWLSPTVVASILRRAREGRR